MPPNTEVPLCCAWTIPNRQGWCVPAPLLWRLVVWCTKVLSLNNHPDRSTLDQILLGKPCIGSWVPGLTRTVNHCEDLTKCWHVQTFQLPPLEITTCGAGMQSRLPASFWPCEGTSRALLAGAGMSRRPGEQQGALTWRALKPPSWPHPPSQIERPRPRSGVDAGGGGP